MKALSKKSSLMASAFFVLSLGLVDSASAAVYCESYSQSTSINRQELTGSSNAQQSVALNGTRSSLIINSEVNLNIGADIPALATGAVTKTTDWLWRVQFSGEFSGDYITATYQFNGQTIGDNKICSVTVPNSCISVTNISVENTDRDTFLGFHTSTRESVRYTMDFSNISVGGLYRGNLEVRLFRGANRNGQGSRPLVCN